MAVRTRVASAQANETFMVLVSSKWINLIVWNCSAEKNSDLNFYSAIIVKYRVF